MAAKHFTMKTQHLYWIRKDDMSRAALW